MRRPILALLTDFGTRDPYVGAMKGAALAICPDVTIVDIGHDVPPHDVLAGALQLQAVYRVFPTGTVFVAVVDPGVGTERRAIGLEACGYTFLAPDNGLLTAVLRDSPPRRCVELTNARYFRSPVSRTFEGRDRFAPAAAWVAKGVDLGELGPPIGEPTHLAWPEPVERDGVLEGGVLTTDRFGNLVTSLARTQVEAFARGRPLEIEVADRTVRLVDTYGDIAPGEICALFGSTDLLELAARSAPAAGQPGFDASLRVRVRRR